MQRGQAIQIGLCLHRLAARQTFARPETVPVAACRQIDQPRLLDVTNRDETCYMVHWLRHGVEQQGRAEDELVTNVIGPGIGSEVEGQKAKHRVIVMYGLPSQGVD